MTIRNIANIIFTNERGEVLLQKKDLLFERWPGRWSFFGGGLEGGESPEEALKREIKEEIGYNLKEMKLFKVLDYVVGDKKGQMHTYIAEFDAPISAISLREGAGFAFFAEEEINSLNIIDQDLMILKEFFTQKNNKINE